MNIIEHIKDKFYEIKWFIQRGRRGYADCDVWDLQAYLSRVIADSVGQLRDKGVSYPVGVTYEQWNSILSQIIEGFDACSNFDLERSLEDPAYVDDVEDKLDTSFDLFRRYFWDLWEYE